ncbi:hypothetical protein [Methanosarcina acetivorans]|nr:hypothetical protein [Methanosarcina acetivorans]
MVSINDLLMATIFCGSEGITTSFPRMSVTVRYCTRVDESGPEEAELES